MAEAFQLAWFVMEIMVRKMQTLMDLGNPLRIQLLRLTREKGLINETPDGGKLDRKGYGPVQP